MFENMAEKTLQEFCAPTTLNIPTRPVVNTGRMESSSSLLSLPWFKPANYVEKLMKMQVHIYNTFYRSTAPSRSEEYQKMLPYSVFSCSHYWGKPSSGSTSTKTNKIHGTYARLLSVGTPYPIIMNIILISKINRW